MTGQVINGGQVYFLISIRKSIPHLCGGNPLVQDAYTYTRAF